MTLTPAQPVPPPSIGWGIASAPLPGQVESGDEYLVTRSPRGVLIAVVDGLGHGSAAASAAATARATLERYAGESLVALTERCHETLVGTRGVAMSLALISPGESRLTWLGVGNVECVLVPTASSSGFAIRTLTLRGGVVGYRLPRLRESTVELQPDDTLVVATDGIRRGFADLAIWGRSPQAIADEILERFATWKDDALVLVARWNGSGEEGG